MPFPLAYIIVTLFSTTPLGILSDQERDSFLEKGSLGLSGLKREISELLSDTREAADIDLPKLLASLALTRMSTVDVLCLAKYLPPFFWSRGLGSP